MSSGVLSPNLTKKFQWEVSQIAEKKLSVNLNLNHLKMILKIEFKT